MSKLAKRFRFDKRNRAAQRAGVSGSDSLVNSLPDPPSSSQQAANAVTFTMASPSLASENLGTQSTTDDTLPPTGLGNADRFLVTRVEDPRVQVVGDQGCTHSAANSGCQLGCAHEIAKATEARKVVDTQKWLDEAPSKAELEASRDEILAALEFDTEKEKSDPKKGKIVTPSFKTASTDSNVFNSKHAEIHRVPNDRKNITRFPQKRSVSSASSSTLSSIPSDLFYGDISRIGLGGPESSAPLENPPFSIPSLVTEGLVEEHLVPNAVQSTYSNERQADIGSTKGASSVPSRVPSERKASMTSKLNFTFKGKPIFSPKPVLPTSGNPTGKAGDPDNRPKAHPKSLRSHSSVASSDQMTAEPGAFLKKNDGRLGTKFSGGHNFFNIGRSPSSNFTPTLGNYTTDFHLSRAPITNEPRSQLFSSPMGSYLSGDKPSADGGKVTHTREELSMAPPAASNVSDPTGESTPVRSSSELLADLNRQATSSTSHNDRATVIHPLAAQEGAKNNSFESGVNLNDPTVDKGKAAETIPSAHPPALEALDRSTYKFSSPLFNIRKKSSLRALRIQLDFFNKILAEIQRKIDKIIIYEPNPALLERLKQLKHAHRGIILTLGAAPIIADMKAVGYEGKLLADLEKFQAKLDEYDWEHEDDDLMANPFGLPAEPAWRGPQFEDD